jgi:hypothetical protein
VRVVYQTGNYHGVPLETLFSSKLQLISVRCALCVVQKFKGLNMKLAISLVCVGLVGCAASPYRLGTQALEAGDHQTAEVKLNAALASGDSEAWNSVGLLYDRTQRSSQAVSAYQMGARHGHAAAQKSLIDKGLPVPPVDLKTDTPMDGVSSLLKFFK